MKLGDFCVFSSFLSQNIVWFIFRSCDVVDVWFSAGCVEFGPEVTSSERSIKVLLNSQDKVGSLLRRLQVCST